MLVGRYLDELVPQRHCDDGHSNFKGILKFGDVIQDGGTIGSYAGEFRDGGSQSSLFFTFLVDDMIVTGIRNLSSS